MASRSEPETQPKPRQSAPRCGIVGGVSTSLSPGLLIATPSLNCPFFGQSLVLLIEHGEEGSFGFVINRESGVDIQDVFTELGLGGPATTSPATPVLVGGPVTPETGWLVFDPGHPSPTIADATLVGDGLAVSASVEVLERLAEGNGPQKSLMFLGYSGWGPGQLDREIMEGSWLPLDMDPHLIFEVPPAERWEAAYHALGIDPATVTRDHIADA